MRCWIVAGLLGLMAAPVAAHEFWLDPDPAVAAPGDSIAVRAFVGSELAGEELGNFPSMQSTVDLFVGGQASKVPGRMGDYPAFRLTPAARGLHVLRYVSAPNTLTYDSYDKYLTFLVEAQREDLAAVHDARGLPREGIREMYYRYAKALFAVGDAAGNDPVTGMPLELVARDNPYQLGPSEPGGGSVSYELLLGGQPLPQAAVHVFVRAGDGVVTSLRLRTGADGRVDVPATAAGFYVVNAIQIFPATPEMTEATGAAWVSLWASSTYTLR